MIRHHYLALLCPTDRSQGKAAASTKANGGEVVCPKTLKDALMATTVTYLSEFLVMYHDTV